MHGMVNTCELSINVGMSPKPKMLPGLRHKALERGQVLDNILSWTPNAPGCCTHDGAIARPGPREAELSEHVRQACCPGVQRSSAVQSFHARLYTYCTLLCCIT